jgi:SWI/SNF-related matrix-associated actin-dependent regulator of chromatin subfamily A member 5
MMVHRDFGAFCRACEKYGRENLSQIAAEVEGKTEDEVRRYAQVRVSELGGL